MSLEIEIRVILDLVQASNCYISDYIYSITVEVHKDNSKVCIYFIITEDNE